MSLRRDWIPLADRDPSPDTDRDSRDRAVSLALHDVRAMCRTAILRNRHDEALVNLALDINLRINGLL